MGMTSVAKQGRKRGVLRVKNSKNRKKCSKKRRNTQKTISELHGVL